MLYSRKFDCRPTPFISLVKDSCFFFAMNTVSERIELIFLSVPAVAFEPRIVHLQGIYYAAGESKIYRHLHSNLFGKCYALKS